MAKLPDFEALTILELRELITAAQSVLDKKVDARRAELMAELSDLGGAPKPSPHKPNLGADKRASVEPKYRSLKNPELTWGGRGQKSKWLIAEMAETGKPLEAFLIK
jgi:DNA-binding protein H-NS